MRDIFSLLNQAGMSSRHTGYFYAAAAITLARAEPQYLLNVTTQLYPRVAEQFGVSWQSVERSIRFALNAAWQAHPEAMHRFCPTPKRPTPTRFLSLMVNALRATE